MIDIAKKAENDEKSEFVGNIPTISKLSRWGWQPSLHHSEIYLTFDRLWLCDHMSIWTNEHNSFQILTYHKIELQLVPLLCWFCDTSLWTSFVHCCIINYNYHNTPYHGQIGRDTTFQNILLNESKLFIGYACLNSAFDFCCDRTVTNLSMPPKLKLRSECNFCWLFWGEGGRVISFGFTK